MRSIDAQPVLVIPSPSPRLEAIARAVLKGAAEESGMAPLPILVAGPEANLSLVASAPLVFLGWRADVAESRRRARETLAAVARLAPTSCHVAEFEASLGTPDDGSTPEGADEGGEAESNLRRLAPVEPFVIASDTGGDSVDPAELARARRWGAQIYSQWRSTLRGPPPGTGREESTPAEGSLGWCGAFE